ncbi:MAG TPA: maleylpyruvate isomerase family mycothiol-dependent enzyme [Dermatophilaceae bacterium]|nr:maleylpyruvate isomerase family mycothiol-dependent enzyme [Dermatophilaceae bacterium]
MDTIDRVESWRVVDACRVAVADLLDGLTAEQLTTPSLCRGWTVRDVGAHLSMAALMTHRETLTAAFRAGFRFDTMIREAALERARSRTTAEITADLRSIVGSRRLAPTTFWRDPLLDALVHSQDIARPLAMSVPEHPLAASVAADWAWRRTLGFPFFAARHLRGLRLVATDADFARGSGEEVRGPVTSLLLLSTGRRTAYDDLTGSGAPRARALTA